jgi:hypothetical protein
MKNFIAIFFVTILLLSCSPSSEKTENSSEEVPVSEIELVRDPYADITPYDIPNDEDDIIELAVEMAYTRYQLQNSGVDIPIPPTFQDSPMYFGLIKKRAEENNVIIQKIVKLGINNLDALGTPLYATYMAISLQSGFFDFSDPDKFALKIVGGNSPEEIQKMLRLGKMTEIRNFNDYTFAVISIAAEEWESQRSGINSGSVPKSNWEYTASSYYTGEANANYSPSNLSNRTGLPWASGKGNGIGDTITIDLVDNPKNSLVFINGYISQDKPNLFRDNSRLRQAKITNKTNGKTITVTIEDSRNEQKVDISSLNPTNNSIIEIQVLSVYEGDKYPDLCIQAIIPE